MSPFSAHQLRFIDVLYIASLFRIGLTFLESVAMLYTFQFNEYRRDRLRSYMQRNRQAKRKQFFLTVFSMNLTRNTLPKPTLKSGFIFAILVMYHAVFIYLASTFVTRIYTPSFESELIIILIVFWIILQNAAETLVITANSLLFPIEFIMRKYYYSKTQQKIERLKKNGLKVVGITGSYGKSTTKFFLHHLLNSTAPTFITEGNVNTPLGLSKRILKNLHENHRFFVAEMGAYTRGEIREMCSFVQPDVGILTGISNQHVELFGSQDNIIKAKSELLEALPKGGTILINKSSKHQPIVPAHSNLNVRYFNKKGQKIDVPTEYIKHIPEFLHPNLESALAMCDVLGVKLNKTRGLFATLPLPPQTMTVKNGYKGALILNDSYSANEIGVFAAIQELCIQPTEKRCIVMPCLIELGSDAKRVHVELGKVCALNNVWLIVTTSDYFDHVREGYETVKLPAEAVVSKNYKCELSENPDDTISRLESKIDASWAVLVEGKVHSSITNFLLTEKTRGEKL